MSRVLAWFSCGSASAYAAKLAVDAVIAGLEHVSIELADSTRATAAALKLCMADRDSLTGK